MDKDMPSVLLVDNKQKNFTILTNLLTEMDVVCVQALSAQAAIKIAVKSEPTLIFLDMQTLGIASWKTAEILKSSAPTQDIPIIFISALNQERSHLYRGYEAGAVDCLLKPLDPHILKSKVRVFLRLYKRKKELEESVQSLRHSQHCFANLIDRAEEAVVIVDVHQQITFFNQAAEDLFGYACSEVLGQSLGLLLPLEDLPAPMDCVKPTSCALKMRQKNQLEKMTEVTVCFNAVNEESHCALIFTAPEPLQANDVQTAIPIGTQPATVNLLLNPQRSQAALHHDLTQERKRIRELGHAFEGLVKFLSSGSGVIQELKSVDQMLNGIEDFLASEQKPHAVNDVIVNTMSLAIDYWQTTTGKTKIELAEESKIWKVYLDKSTFRTKTLDRYLSVESLPKKPRWKDVVATAQYVMTFCHEPSSEQEHSLYSALKLASMKCKNLYQTHADATDHS